MINKFGLIGEKLGHSFSPLIHGMLCDYEYNLYEISKERLSDFMKNTDLRGFNVTIPYKQEIMKYCYELSESAKSIGSVNTVICRDNGSFYGDNTDCYGFEYLLKKSKVSVKGKKAVVLGSGGASKTVQWVLNSLECSEIIIISRTGLNNYNNLSEHYDAEIIINTTPVGMYPGNGKSPIDITPFKNCRLIVDLIYNPHKTALILQGEELGIPSFNGLSMLVAQAKKACEIFTEQVIDDSIIDSISNTISLKTSNIVLIGMPGCGKTTIGRTLSEKTGRKFIDIDQSIEEYSGISIPEIFEGKYNTEKLIKDKIIDEMSDNQLSSEQIFRKIETHILSEITKESGIIIATGGGVVTVPENKDLLKQNSIIIQLERTLSELPSDNRPLSKSKGIDALYLQRKPLYDEWCDFNFTNSSITDTTNQIIEKIRL